MASQDVPRITAQELRARTTRGEAVIPLDVRTAAAIGFQPEQIPGSRWLPLADVVERAGTLPRDALIATY